MIPIFVVLWLFPGHIWTNSWDDGHNRTLNLFDEDPYEKPARVQFSGDGSAYMNGNGTMSLTGNAPRYRVLEQFHNVNITLYAKRVSEATEIDSAGFVIAARSRHYTDQTCGADTYYGQLTYDGRVTFEKELFHSQGDDAFYPNVKDNSAQIYAFKDGVPADKWIGIRFIVKSDPNNSTLLQLYLDKQDNGQWQKVLEYTDKGDWSVDPGISSKKLQKKCEGFYPTDKIISSPGFVFVRNDGLGRTDYRNFTIMEMN